MKFKWPFCLKKTMENRLNEAHALRRSLEKNLREEIERTKESVGRIADRCSMIQWFREGESYELRLRMDPRAFGTGYYADQKLVAEMIGRKVEAEIASSKFIKSANAE